MPVVAACFLAVAAAPAIGGTRGPGGAVYVAKPEISKITCLRQCASRRRARGGSTLKISGRALASVTTVVFHGSYGRGDDTRARVRPGSAVRVQARVPVGAVSGPISVLVSPRLRSRRSRPIPILPAPPPEGNTDLTPVPGPREPGAPRLETGTSRTRAFFGARRAVTFSYRVSDGATVQVELVRASDGARVRSWEAGPVEPGAVATVVWDGRLGTAAAAPGRYAFRLSARGANGATARSAQSQDYLRDSFDLYDTVFPVRGRHDFGGPGARFGAGRAGHSHQGQDVFAPCGTRLVAARGGRVKHKAYHRAAGYYLVIDGLGTDLDYVYMHLAEPTPFAPGDLVYTGQRVGAVGQTGNARGCHLHFELWRGGWYSGGRPFDPYPALRAWDGWS